MPPCKAAGPSGGGELKDKEGKVIPPEVIESWGRVVDDISLYFYCGQRYEEKSGTVREWMEQDRWRDELLENAVMPRGFRCLACGSGMILESKDLHIGFDSKPDRVLFMFRCDNADCKKGRAFYEGGEEWRPQPFLCEKCRHEIKSSYDRKGNIITTTYKCTGCDYIETEILDLDKKEKPVMDPNYQKDRAEFCFDQKWGGEYISAKASLVTATDAIKEIQERENNKALYDEVAKLKKLPVAEVQKVLAEALENNHYINLQFQPPDMSRDLVVSFTAMDGKSDRVEYDSTHSLKKLIETVLADTNWKLMSDGINYRSGYVSGRLRCLEREEDLVELVRKQAKENSIK